MAEKETRKKYKKITLFFMCKYTLHLLKTDKADRCFIPVLKLHCSGDSIDVSQGLVSRRHQKKTGLRPVLYNHLRKQDQ
jgi:hypothetical protein